MWIQSSKHEKDVAGDFSLDWMMLKNSRVMEVDMEESEKEKAVLGKPEIMEAADVSKDG